MDKNYEKFYIYRIYNNKEEILYQSDDYKKIKNIFNTIVKGQGNPVEIKNWKKNDSRWENVYFLSLQGKSKINKCSKTYYDSLYKSPYFPIIRRKFEVVYTEISFKSFDVKSLENQNIKVIEPSVHPGLYGCDPPKACVLEANYYEDIDKAFYKLREKRQISWFWIILMK